MSRDECDDAPAAICVFSTTSTVLPDMVSVFAIAKPFILAPRMTTLNVLYIRYNDTKSVIFHEIHHPQRF